MSSGKWGYPVHSQVNVVTVRKSRFIRRTQHRDEQRIRCYRYFFFAPLSSLNYLTWNGMGESLEAATRADCKISPARGTVLEGIGSRKHIPFAALLLALAAFWEVICIVDFRLLFLEKRGPV